MTIPGPGYPSTDDAFAAAIRRAREVAGLSQDEVAERMADRGFSFHRPTVYKIEAGTRKVTIAEAVALATVVGFRLQDLTVDEPGGLKDERIEMLSRARVLMESIVQAMAYLDRVRLLQESLEDLVRNSPFTVTRGALLDFEGRSAHEYFAPLSSAAAVHLLSKPWETYRRLLDEPDLSQLASDVGVDLERVRGLMGPSPSAASDLSVETGPTFDGANFYPDDAAEA